MSKEKCRTGTRIATNKKRGMLVTKLLECHRADCPHCQGKRVDKYFDLMTKPVSMELYHNVVSNKEARDIALSVRRSGGFYWMCPLKDGNAVLVTTDNRRLQGAPLPTDNEFKLKQVLRQWIDSQNPSMNISHTRPAVPKTKRLSDPEDKWNVHICGIKPAVIHDILDMSGWIDRGNGLYVTPNSGSYAEVDDVFRTVTDEFRYMVVPLKGKGKGVHI